MVTNISAILFALLAGPANFKGALMSSSRTRRRNPGHSLRVELKTRQIGRSRVNWRLTWDLRTGGKSIKGGKKNVEQTD